MSKTSRAKRQGTARAKTTNRPAREPARMPDATVEAMAKLIDMLDDVASLARRLRLDPDCPLDPDDLRAVEYAADHIGGGLESQLPLPATAALECRRGSAFGELLAVREAGGEVSADLGRRLRAWLDGDDLTKGVQPSGGAGVEAA